MEKRILKITLLVMTIQSLLLAGVAYVLFTAPKPKAALASMQGPEHSSSKILKGDGHHVNFKNEGEAVHSYLSALDRAITVEIILAAGVDPTYVIEQREAAEQCKNLSCDQINTLTSILEDTGRKPPPKPKI